MAIIPCLENTAKLEKKMIAEMLAETGELPSLYEAIRIAITQVPNLCVLGYLVYIFLSHISKRDVLIKQIHDESQEAQELFRQVLKENTQALTKNTLVTEEVLEELQRKNRNV